MPLITPQMPEAGYVEIPYGADHSATDIGWTTHTVPGYFKVWIPRGRVNQIGLLVFGAGAEYGTICLSYGKLPTAWDDQGPFARHGQVPLDQLNQTVFQFAGTGQVVWQIFPTPFLGGDTWLYGAIAGGSPFALQVVMKMEPVDVEPPVPPVPVDKKQECTVKPTTGRLVVLHPGATLTVQKQVEGKTVFKVNR